MDFRALLVKYAQHVLDTEGEHYLARYYRYPDTFTAAENAVLDEVQAEIEAAKRARGEPPMPSMDDVTRRALEILHAQVKWTQ